MKSEIHALIGDLARGWVEDPASDVVHCEEVEGRWAVRMRQRTRDFTTVWFEVGDRSVRYEAYVIPALGAWEADRLCMRWNERAWRAHFSTDGNGDIYLRGRLALDRVTADELDSALAEIYEQVEVAFRPLLRAIREKKA